MLQFRLEQADDIDYLSWMYNPWNLLSISQLYDELGYYTCLIDNDPSDEERELYMECLKQVVQELELRQSKYNWH